MTNSNGCPDPCQGQSADLQTENNPGFEVHDADGNRVLGPYDSEQEAQDERGRIEIKAPGVDYRITHPDEGNLTRRYGDRSVLETFLDGYTIGEAPGSTSSEPLYDIHDQEGDAVMGPYESQEEAQDELDRIEITEVPAAGSYRVKHPNEGRLGEFSSESKAQEFLDGLTVEEVDRHFIKNDRGEYIEGPFDTEEQAQDAIDQDYSDGIKSMEKWGGDGKTEPYDLDELTKDQFDDNFAKDMAGLKDQPKFDPDKSAEEQEARYYVKDARNERVAGPFDSEKPAYEALERRASYSVGADDVEQFWADYYKQEGEKGPFETKLKALHAIREERGFSLHGVGAGTWGLDTNWYVYGPGIGNEGLGPFENQRAALESTVTGNGWSVRRESFRGHYVRDPRGAKVAGYFRDRLDALKAVERKSRDYRVENLDPGADRLLASSEGEAETITVPELRSRMDQQAPEMDTDDFDVNDYEDARRQEQLDELDAKDPDEDDPDEEDATDLEEVSRETSTVYVTEDGAEDSPPEGSEPYLEVERVETILIQDPSTGRRWRIHFNHDGGTE